MHLFTTGCLMALLLWAYRFLLNCQRRYSNSNPQPQSGAPKSVNSGATGGSIRANHRPRDQRTKTLISAVLLFAACYTFVYFIHNNTENFIRVHTSFSATDGGDANGNMNTDHNNNVVNNNRNSPTFELLTPDQISTRFSSVAGLETAKDEVQDIIRYLKNPKRFARLGAKPPKGILLYGPPGTGKTLLARAIAGEANTSFIAASGSEFDEEYVGVGAMRIRELFETARKHSPCIIFIDEIDSVAYKRSAKYAPWAAQTVNQLLSELDGLNDEQNKNVMLIAASNRLDALDPAILRPGRIDRHLKLELPTQKERQAILELHIQDIVVDSKVSTKQLAKMTSGFSSAELANLINEAAIWATKQNKKVVDMSAFEVAKEKMVMGLDRSSLIIDDKEKKITAYHEAGHALVGHLLKHSSLYKVTIRPKGPSLGHTSFEQTSDSDSVSYSQEYLDNLIATQLGGRIAEEIIFGERAITTGAANDLQQATNVAYNMVTKWGYSKEVGLIYADNGLDFIPKSAIQQEVNKIIQKNYKNAKELLIKHKNKLHVLAKALLEHETLDAEEVTALLK